MIKTFTIPQQHVAELIEVFGEGYAEMIPDEEGTMIPNPQTKAQFANEVFDESIISHVRYRVVNYRRRSLPEVDKTDIISIG